MATRRIVVVRGRGLVWRARRLLLLLLIHFSKCHSLIHTGSFTHNNTYNFYAFSDGRDGHQEEVRY